VELNTRLLFLDLLPLCGADIVCDVGSMNGHDALAFRRVLPRARVLAFEPNPHNLMLMRADQRLVDRHIEIMPLAATNYDGEAQFHLVRADYSSAHHRRGMSSLHEREDEALRAGAVTVRAARLDTVLRPGAGPRRVALWLDVEGNAFEALEGAGELLRSVCLLHVEVETRPCIGRGQRLYGDVRRLVTEAGLVEIATDQASSAEQFNALYLRRDAGPALAIAWHLVRRKTRRLATGLARRVSPAAFHRWQRWHARRGRADPL
jgi:FkbM family methyltransferase